MQSAWVVDPMNVREPSARGDDHATLYKARAARLQYRLMGAGIILMAGVGVVGLLALWNQNGFSSPPGLPILLGILLFPLLVPIGVVFFLHSRRLSDIQIAGSSVRLPFKSQPKRNGWRELSEILFMGDAFDRADFDGSEGTLVQRVTALRTDRRAKIRVDIWKHGGGLLIITNDEVLLLRRSEQITQGLIRHWKAWTGRQAQAR